MLRFLLCHCDLCKGKFTEFDLLKSREPALSYEFCYCYHSIVADVVVVEV
jgi:hypothetical protein